MVVNVYVCVWWFQNEGELISITALKSEVLAVISDPHGLGLSPACTAVVNMAEEVIYIN